MATKTLLQIVNQALRELGIPALASIATSSDPTAVQCLSLLNREGEELVEIEDGWPTLSVTQTIVLVPGQEAYDFPDDISFYIEETIWNATRRWRAVNVSPREWQTLRCGFALGGPWTRFRLRDGQIHFDPVPATADTISVEYASENFCASSGGEPQNAWLADTDVPRVSQKLFVLGLKWRLLAAKGMNYAEERDAYDKAVDRTKARAYSTGSLPLGRRGNRFGPIGEPVIPIGDWPAS